MTAVTGFLDKKKTRLQEQIMEWAADNLARYPWRCHGVSPYHVLIGELWLERLPSPIAVWVYHCFVQHFPCVGDVAKARRDELSCILSSFGLEEQAPEMIDLARRLLSEGRGALPGDSEILGRISGLDKHSIQSLLCFGYDLPVAVVDSNVARMLSRIFGKTFPFKLSEGSLNALGESLLPARRTQVYSRGLLELAEMICRVEPLCSCCPVAGECDKREDFVDAQVCPGFPQSVVL